MQHRLGFRGIPTGEKIDSHVALDLLGVSGSQQHDHGQHVLRKLECAGNGLVEKRSAHHVAHG